MTVTYNYVYVILFAGYLGITAVDAQQCSACGPVQQTANYSLQTCSCLKSWTDASADCQSRGMTLAQINDVAMETVISRELQSFAGGSLGEAWIDGKIDTTDWTWTNSKSPLYGQGCYTYPSSSSSFNFTLQSQQMTPTMCISSCQQRNQLYAGLHKGDTCVCMHSFSRSSLSTGCTQICTGDANQWCGGANVYYVYAVKGVKTIAWSRGDPSSQSTRPEHLCVTMSCQYLPSATWTIKTDSCKVTKRYSCMYKKDGACPSNSIQVGDYCYTRSNVFATWYEANHVCRRNGGSLTEMTSQEVFRTLTTSPRRVIQCFHVNVWLGASKTLMQWSNGVSMSYSNWGAGYPSTNAGPANCVFMYTGQRGAYQWADQQCNGPVKPFVCMNDTRLITTTSTSTTTTTPSTSSSTTTPSTSRLTTTPPTSSLTTTPPTSSSTTTTTPSTSSSTTTPSTSSSTTTTTPSTSSSTTTTPSTISSTRPITSRSSTKSSTPLTSSTTASTSTTITPPSSTASTSITPPTHPTSDTNSVKSTLPGRPSTTPSTTVRAISSSSTISSAMNTTSNTTVRSAVSSTTVAVNGTLQNNSVGAGSTLEVTLSTRARGAVTDRDGSEVETTGIVLIVIAGVILTIFLFMALLCCFKPCWLSYLRRREKEAGQSANRSAFIKDADFSYMDVSNEDSTAEKSTKKIPKYDREKSLQRYNSLDIDKSLTTDETANNSNMNFLNNQTQTGSSLNAQTGMPLSTAAPTRGQVNYIDNVGANPKDSNLQQDRNMAGTVHQMPYEDQQTLPTTPVNDALDAPPSSAIRTPQKTVIEVTADEDITHSQSGEAENDGFINDELLLDADYAHPREYSLSYV